MREKIDLTQFIDSRLWVSEWMDEIKLNPNIPTDEEAMLSWFCNAIFTGIKEESKKETALHQEIFRLHQKNGELLLEIDRLKKTQSAASILGSIKTEKKARSSAENGKKGGRPKKPVTLDEMMDSITPDNMHRELTNDFVKK